VIIWLITRRCSNLNQSKIKPHYRKKKNHTKPNVFECVWMCSTYLTVTIVNDNLFNFYGCLAQYVHIYSHLNLNWYIVHTYISFFIAKVHTYIDIFFTMF